MLKSQIAKKILTYLADHPDAKDTLDGILQWWLLEQQIKHEVESVREIVSERVKGKLLLKRKSRDSRVHYRLNRKKYEEIQALLKEMIFQ